MFPEITPDAIRKPALKRRLRGYDTQETEELLLEVAESCERVRAEREALSEQLESLRHDQAKHERDARVELDKLQEQLSDRDGRIAELNAEIARFEEEHSKQLEEVERLSKEVSSARATQEAQQAELAEQSASLARLDTREKALVEQIAMFAAQLGQGDAGFAAPTSPRALSDVDERAAATLLRLDRVVETVARETRRDTEMMLKKARERADEILHSAEVRSRRIVEEIARQGPVDETVRAEFDPVAALERVEELETEPEAADDPQTADDAEQQLGEALWTSGVRPEQIPERSDSLR
jgi:cell division septum initiation protein DivIVA